MPKLEVPWPGLFLALTLACGPTTSVRADERLEALMRLTAAHAGELHTAARQGDVKRVRRLLEKGADANELDRNSQTPLMVAASARRHEVLSLLIEQGADPDLTSSAGWSPLHAAVLIGDREAVEILLEAGASAQSRHPDGWTPLHQAAQDHREADFVAWYLQQEGVDALARTKRTSMTAFHVAAQNGRGAVVRAFLGHGLSPEEKADGGWTTLHCAAARGHDEVVRALLDGGVDPGSRSEAGETALEVAERKGHASTVELLKSAAPSDEG